MNETEQIATLKTEIEILISEKIRLAKALRLVISSSNTPRWAEIDAQLVLNTTGFKDRSMDYEDFCPNFIRENLYEDAIEVPQTKQPQSDEVPNDVGSMVIPQDTVYRKTGNNHEYTDTPPTGVV